MQRRRRFGYVLALGLLALPWARGALAFPGGIAGTVFGATGCPLCHVGGVTPTVLLDGPTALQPDETAEYTFTIFGNPTQNYGGLNVSAPDGTLTTGGVYALDTRTILGLLGLQEITHSEPKPGSFMSIIEFSFQWTAPSHGGTVTLRAWGNAVNHDGTSTGDAAAMTTLDVAVSGPPGATATPTPTATPATCADAAPLQPPLVSSPDAQACQAALAKLGALYVKKDLKAVQKCLRALHAGAISGDAGATCVGSATTLPADGKTAETLAKAEDKVRTALAATCTNDVLPMLDACATTEIALEECFLGSHRQAVVDAVAAQYGTLIPNADKDVQKCQSAVGNAAGRYLTAYLGASEKCLVARNAAGAPIDGAAQCVGVVSGGSFVPPADADAAETIAKALAKLQKKLAAKCGGGKLAPLDTCADDVPGALACLVCSHQSIVFDMVSSEFGGTP
jgi:hypothetical protein